MEKFLKVMTHWFIELHEIGEVIHFLQFLDLIYYFWSIRLRADSTQILSKWICPFIFISLIIQPQNLKFSTIPGECSLIIVMKIGWKSLEWKLDALSKIRKIGLL